MPKGDANDSLSIEDEVEELVRIAIPLSPAMLVVLEAPTSAKQVGVLHEVIIQSIET
jgi:hypothetical protein